ncbi:phosphopantetheine-binding protein [Actinosynnema sp. NPDC002837]
MSEGSEITALNPDFEAVLRECMAGQLPPGTTLHEDSDLTAFGMDSLTVVRLLVTIEDTFGVVIPDEMIAFEIFSSPGSLWNLISDSREDSG